MILGTFIQKYGIEEKFDFERFWAISKKSLIIYDWYRELYGCNREIVPDGKIDTTNFAYPVDWDRPPSRPIPHGVEYGVDYSYRELYTPIERPIDFRWFELEDEWFLEESNIRGYRKNK